MKIEVKNVRVHHRLSESATAFTVSLYVNGHRVGEVSGDGKTHEIRYDVDEDVRATVDSYCKSLPAEEGHAMDLDWFILLRVREDGLRQEAKRLMKNRVVFLSSKGDVMQSPKLTPEEKAVYKLPRGAKIMTVTDVVEHLVVSHAAATTGYVEGGVRVDSATTGPRVPTAQKKARRT